MSPNGIDVIEIETPPDKTDLVRLNDDYGRQKQGYEGLAEMRLNNLDEFDHFYFGTPKAGKIFYHNSKSYRITLEGYNSSNESQLKIKNESLYSLFNGQLSDDKGNAVLEIGDTVRGADLSRKIFSKNEPLLFGVTENSAVYKSG